MWLLPLEMNLHLTFQRPVLFDDFVGGPFDSFELLNFWASIYIFNYQSTPHAPTQKCQAVEDFVYSVENNKIVHTYGEIPEGHGPTALMDQLGIAKN